MGGLSKRWTGSGLIDLPDGVRFSGYDNRLRKGSVGTLREIRRTRAAAEFDGKRWNIDTDYLHAASDVPHAMAFGLGATV